MPHPLTLVLLTLCFLDFLLLATDPLRASVRWVAWQGWVVGCLPLLVPSTRPWPQLLGLALASMVLKGLVIPGFLLRGLREVRTRHDGRSPTGVFLALLAGLACFGASLPLGSRLPAPAPGLSRFALPAGFFTAATGLLLLAGRGLALFQVVGYLALENGIYVLGVSLALEQPLLVETGVLLDLFVAAFLMGILVFHIQRAFDHIDTDQLTLLKDRHP